MATISELDTKKISALTRKTLSADLDYLDYLVFNDRSAGDTGTMAITVDALDSYFKVNVGHIGRTALSGDSSVDYGVMPHIQAVTLSGANMRSTATFTANNLTGTKISGTGLCGDAAYILSTLTATTLSAENIHAANLSGILESQVKTDLNQQGGSSSFGHVIIEGDLKVHGTTVTTSASNLAVRDPIIEVAKDQTAPEVDFGLLGNRGSAQNSAVIYDESADEWAFIYTDDNASTSGNITIASYTDFQANDVTFNAATITQGGNITNLNATNLSTGSIPDGRVTSSNVTQHEASLTLATGQITSGTFADARISESSVTQHEAALTIASSQVTGLNLTSGTFTPTLTLGSGSVSYTTQDGYYTRIGDVVYCTEKLVLRASTSPDGALTLGGFPVTSANNTGGEGVGALAASNLNFETNRSELPSNANVSVKMIPNATTAKIIFTDSEAAMLEATGTSLNSNTTLQFSVFYQA